jgi:hypothetical protein
MINNKQSSVELLAIALYEGGYLQGNGDEINDLLKQHKAIHKEEIEEAYEEGSHTIWDEDTWMLLEKREYYNETFGGNK